MDKIFVTLGASNHTEKEREENDFYATSPEAINALLTKEELSKEIWEPCCGQGHLSKRLKEFGYNVYSSDIIDRGYCDEILDFLTFNGVVDKDIVTNPPYQKGLDIVLKALDSVSDGHKVCMFLKITFLEGQTRYSNLYSKYPPARIHVFSKRVLCAKNGDFKKMKDGGGSAIAYAWYVWEKGYIGETKLDWISDKKGELENTKLW